VRGFFIFILKKKILNARSYTKYCEAIEGYG